MTTISSREFNQDTGKAKREAIDGPVFITDRGNPSFVLMRYEDYVKINKPRKNFVELLAMPDAEDIEFDPPKMNYVPKPAEFD